MRKWRNHLSLTLAFCSVFISPLMLLAWVAETIMRERVRWWWVAGVLALLTFTAAVS